MTGTFGPLLFACSMFLGMLLFQEVGRRIGIRRVAKHPEERDLGAGAMQAGVFALLGLLIAFTFSGAASRFDDRRKLVAQEANAIGTAYLRLDLLSSDARSTLRRRFSQYVDARLAFYRTLPNIEAARQEWVRSTTLQNEIWAQAIATCRVQTDPPTCMLLLPAINEMIDITTTRMTAMMTHPPTIIFVLLFGLALGSSLVAGYEMSGSTRRSWTHMIMFAAMTAFTVYIILDLEYPRAGLIRVDAGDQVLLDLQESMK
ncbi:MAG TPA: hypothetical protein VJT11_07260 [Nitrospiraceae bacterium]|nr:hypothetical protein [Nitrospiraceae bacterium]